MQFCCVRFPFMTRTAWWQSKHEPAGTMTLESLTLRLWTGERRVTVFEGMSAFRQGDFTLTGRGEPVHLTGAVASANLFSVLGVAPALGRGFLPNEDKPGTSPPIVLSHSLWQNRFGADQKIIGQNLTLDGKSFSVVGVMPAGFQFPVERTPWIFGPPLLLIHEGPRQ